MGLLLAAFAALGNLLGGALVARSDWSARTLHYLVAVGAGFLLAVALLRMLPQALEMHPTGALAMVLGGYLLTHLFEHALVPHFHYGEETHDDIVHGRSSVAATTGLALHSLFDGVSIAAGYHFDPVLGWLVFAAIGLHKLPEGFTIASIVRASGGTRRAALASAGIVGGACVVGAAAIAGGPSLAGAGLAVGTGVTLYVAATDLVPEVNKEVGHRLALTVLAGAALYGAIALVLALLGAP
ncbi:MAG: ZIP family metal transporter [Gemmatimonadota bacterium]|nr:ZIP family metal transporter [Gemmatimonadota bacterium]